MSIIILTDVLDLRARQRRELAFYRQHKIDIEQKLSRLARDLELTDYILSLITAEHHNELSIGPHNKITPASP